MQESKNTFNVSVIVDETTKNYFSCLAYRRKLRFYLIFCNRANVIKKQIKTNHLTTNLMMINLICIFIVCGVNHFFLKALVFPLLFPRSWTVRRI